MKKAEKHYGDNFIWVLGGIPEPNSESDFEYYIIPLEVMSKNITRIHQEWLDTPGVKGQKHNDTNVRTVPLPKNGIPSAKWNILEYLNRWDLIEEKLK